MAATQRKRNKNGGYLTSMRARARLVGGRDRENEWDICDEAYDCFCPSGRGRNVWRAARPASDLPAHAKTAPVYKAPPNLPYNWAGFYLGINGGYNFGQSSWSDPAAGADSGKFSTKGGLLGGQVGYNWQVGKTVLGVESDIDWAKVSARPAAASAPPTAAANAKASKAGSARRARALVTPSIVSCLTSPAAPPMATSRPCSRPALRATASSAGPPARG